MTSLRVLMSGLMAVSIAAANDAEPEDFAFHAQATYVEQETGAFAAPYRGPYSLTPSSGRETFDATLYLGMRLGSGAELWINPEIDQGFGLDDTQGLAGFPSGEAYKVGRDHPYLRLPRLFVRETLDRGAADESVDGAADQLAGSRSANRWVFTVGKFGVTDIFDANQYAHDPRTDFLNWAAVDSGTFDYAADAWGYTVGVVVERYLGAWVLRGGVFDLSNVPNSEHLEPGFHEFQIVGEVQIDVEMLGRPGRLRITAFDSRGRMALLDQATALAQATNSTPDPAAVRAFRSRLGVALDWEQPLGDALGVFARLGKAAGNVEVYEFADIDRSIEIGASVKGVSSRRPDDVVGIAAIDNGISAERERYLNSGGLGILIGDGRLPHPAPEQIIETYYALAATARLDVTLDYQWVRNPAYNSDRGPVSIVAARVHVQF